MSITHGHQNFISSEPISQLSDKTEDKGKIIYLISKCINMLKSHYRLVNF